MADFDDSAGRQWRLSITASDFARIQALFAFDLLKQSDRARIVADRYLLTRVLYILLEADCRAGNVSETEFATALPRDLAGAAEALYLAIIEYYDRRIANRAWSLN